jgi:hypothetical protein
MVACDEYAGRHPTGLAKKTLLIKELWALFELELSSPIDIY